MPKIRRRTVIIALTAALTAGAAVAATAAAAGTIEQTGCPGDMEKVAGQRAEPNREANPLMCY